MKIKSVKFNFIMNFILTASSFIFPLVTFPYVSRVLMAEGNGIVTFVTSVMTYFTMFASLGIPTYGIRVCATVRNNKEELSKVTQELIIINLIITAFVSAVFIASVFLIPEFKEEKTLFFINGISLLLNAVGATWFYSGIEQYSYITIRSLVFKVISIILMFIFVKKASDYVIYGAITVLATAGSYILNFINLKKFISFKKVGKYNFRRHMKPIIIFFGTSAAISIYTNLDIVMLKFMQDNAAVGYYNAGIKVKVVLANLVTSRGAVLLPRLSFYVEEKRFEEFRKMVVKAINFVVLISLPLCIYFIIMARESILLLSGDGYMNAILPMQFLMPTVLFIGLSNLTGMQVLVPLNKEHQMFIAICCGAVLDFVLNIFLIKEYAATGAALSTLLAEIMVLAVECFVFLRKDFWKTVKQIDFWKILVPAAVGTIVLLVINNFMSGVFWKLVVTAIAFFGTYGLGLLVLKETFVKEQLMPIINKVLNKIFGKLKKNN